MKLHPAILLSQFFFLMTTAISPLSHNYFCQLKCGFRHICCRSLHCSLSRLCGPHSSQRELRDEDRLEVVDIINYLRGETAKGLLTPGKTIGNMMAVSYDKELEFIAQCTANRCLSEQFYRCSCSSKFEVVGSTYFASRVADVMMMDQKRFIDFSFKRWADNVKYITRKTSRNWSPRQLTWDFKNAVQMVAANVTHVGCGRVFGSRFGSTLICMYGPLGLKRNQPIWIEGPPCSSCPEGLPCSNGLCGSVSRNISEDSWMKPGEYQSGPLQEYYYVFLGVGCVLLAMFGRF